MKVIILAGGMGSRLGSISELLPKPMVKVGDKPIIWHIMKIYSSYGYNDFIICLGYKGQLIKDFFPGQNSAGIAAQQPEKIKLRTGQVDTFTFQPGFTH